MKINYNYIKFSLLAIFMVVICSFSTSKNKKRLVSKPNIEFVGANNLFITSETVSNLLIQKQKEAKNLTKEALDLNSLEQSLMKNPMISSAEVYVNTQGALSAKILQKQPIARVVGTSQFYVDSEGGFMPLSKNYTERVPFVTGTVKKDDLSAVFTIAQFIKTDAFLTKQVVEIHQNEFKEISLKLREANFEVRLGELKQLEKKINNLKAFYVKASRDNALGNYRLVNLQFDNQVVCTKV